MQLLWASAQFLTLTQTYRVTQSPYCWVQTQRVESRDSNRYLCSSIQSIRHENQKMETTQNDR